MNVIKKILAVLSVILCFVSITGCDSIDKVIDDNAVTINIPLETAEPEIGERDNKMIYIWTDEDTGVQYIIYREKCAYAGFGGITPRLNPDGSLYCVEDKTE